MEHMTYLVLATCYVIRPPKVLYPKFRESTVDPINYVVRTEQNVAQSEIECRSIRSKVSANQELNFALTGTKCRPIRNKISLP
jgi:hypothetical protein